MIRTVNPATGEELATYDGHDAKAIDAALDAAVAAFAEWRRRPVEDRAAVLVAAADLLAAERDEHARIMALEMGKPITQARAEADKCALVCRHYAEHGAAYIAEEDVATEAARSYVRSEPLGPVLAVMPWNFPYWQVLRFAAPALLAGNVGLLKHASNVPGCALAIESLFRRAGAPDGVFQALLIGSAAVEGVIADPRVRAATVTGSEAAGRAVARAAGDALKPTVLELGGSDPFIVLADADLDAAVATAVTARLVNSGQSCIAAKRFIVDERVADEFTSRFVAAMEDTVVGDPLDDATQVGPLARPDLVDDLHSQVTRTIDAGGLLRTGGRPLDRPGCFYLPTVLDQVRLDHAAACEETFGPVAAIVGVGDDDEAIAAANATEFGLGASLWTADRDRAARLVPEIQAGAVFVNEMVKSDPRLPFGGIKRSGYGRELARDGILAFMNRKTVWMR